MPIPHTDFGGRGPTLHFSHPNAYTPGSFRPFLAPLTAHFHVLAAHHRPLWHLSPGYGAADAPEGFIDWTWDAIADDLLRFLDEQRLEQVIGVGHSLGAVATMMAARKEPQRFRALVLIEPVFLPPHVLQAIRAHPKLAAERPFVLAALRRRDRWPSRADAFARFREKPVFARWSDEALWAYVNDGLHEDPATGEVVLSYPREWEARFYARPPTNVWDEIPALAHPTLAVRATESDTLFPDAWALWQNLQPAATFVEMDGVGHMLTAEAPEDLAALVMHWLEDRDLVRRTF
ncbi:MAG: alpha/beta hydrolase [Candidatus Promineofilum sp.]|nr:alpha/beta hydrolase [Promineifilum sp.]